VTASIPDPSNLHFERRIIMREDVGHAFQEFAWEALSLSEFAGRLLVQHPIRGVDGGIDLIQEEGGRLTALECKFHSDDRADSPEADWKKVAKILKATLPALLAAEPEARAKAPHAPWLDQERPISAYWFCTSAALPNQNALDRLKRRIQDDLKFIAGLQPGLRHLREVDVQVRAAQHFAGILARHAPLRLRWFGGLPTGLKAVDTYGASTRTFRRYLHDSSLPYFSFAEFARLAKLDADFLPDPEHLLDRLLEGSRPALVISGRGGIGKTRLALEVAVAAQRRGMLALSCGPAAHAASIEALAKCHIDSASVLIVMDYAEAHPNLAAIASAIEAVNSAGHCFRFVATCRSSGALGVQHALEDLGALPILMGENREEATSSAYADWVMRRILAHGDLENVPGLASVCAGLPVLATFALHLRQDQPRNFERLFGNLTSEISFEQWSTRRLDIMLATLGGVRSEALRRMAEVSAMLPLAPSEAGDLRVASRPTAAILDILIEDGWLDEEDGSIRAAHDVFADAILSAYLFEQGAPAQMRALDVLEEARAAGALGRGLTAIDRLGGHPRFRGLDGAALIRSIRQSDPRAPASIIPEIFQSPLFTPVTLLELIREDEPMRIELATNPLHESSLLFFCKEILRRSDEMQRKRAAEVLRTVIDAHLKRGDQPTNMLLARGFAIDPDFLADRALAEMKSNPDSHQTHYLIGAWLNAQRPRNAIADVVEKWLERHSSDNAKSSWVIRGWLQAHGDRELVRRHVQIWLGRFFAIPEAEFVYAAWLYARGGKEEIAEPLRAWLDLHSRRLDARFVYAAWLDSEGEWEAIADDVRRWLDRHGEQVYATHVYGAWLRAHAPLETIGNDIRRWLELHGEHLDACHLYRAWLRERKDSDAIRAYVGRWLAIHGTAAEAGHVFMGWLGCRADISVVAAALRAWLDLHAELPGARFIYVEWLDIKYPAEIVASAIRRWLDVHSETLVAQSVMCSWLRAEFAPASIEADVRRWLGLHGDRLEAGFLLRWWLDGKGALEVVAGHVQAWLGLHGLTIDANYIYRAWLDAKGDIGAVEDGVRQWFPLHGETGEVEFLIFSWVKAGGAFEVVRQSAFRWLKLNIHSPASLYLMKYIVRQPDLPWDIVASAAVWCKLNASNPEAISRIRPLLYWYCTPETQGELQGIALDMLERLDPDDLEVGSIRISVLGVLGLMASSLSRSRALKTPYGYRLSAIHAYFIQSTRLYDTADSELHPRFVRQLPLVYHVCHLVEAAFLDRTRDKAAIDYFLDWLKAWPPEDRHRALLAGVRLGRCLGRPLLGQDLGLGPHAAPRSGPENIPVDAGAAEPDAAAPR
jgi:hypothetical protein